MIDQISLPELQKIFSPEEIQRYTTILNTLGKNSASAYYNDIVENYGGLQLTHLEPFLDKIINIEIGGSSKLSKEDVEKLLNLYLVVLEMLDNIIGADISGADTIDDKESFKKRLIILRARLSILFKNLTERIQSLNSSEFATREINDEYPEAYKRFASSELCNTYTQLNTREYILHEDVRLRETIDYARRLIDPSYYSTPVINRYQDKNNTIISDLEDRLAELKQDCESEGDKELFDSSFQVDLDSYATTFLDSFIKAAKSHDYEFQVGNPPRKINFKDIDTSVIKQAFQRHCNINIFEIQTDLLNKKTNFYEVFQIGKFFTFLASIDKDILTGQIKHEGKISAAIGSMISEEFRYNERQRSLWGDTNTVRIFNVFVETHLSSVINYDFSHLHQRLNRPAKYWVDITKERAIIIRRNIATNVIPEIERSIKLLKDANEDNTGLTTSKLTLTEEELSAQTDILQEIFELDDSINTFITSETFKNLSEANQNLLKALRTKLNPVLIDLYYGNNNGRMPNELVEIISESFVAPNQVEVYRPLASEDFYHFQSSSQEYQRFLLNIVNRVSSIYSKHAIYNIEDNPFYRIEIAKNLAILLSNLVNNTSPWFTLLDDQDKESIEDYIRQIKRLLPDKASSEESYDSAGLRSITDEIMAFLKIRIKRLRPEIALRRESLNRLKKTFYSDALKVLEKRAYVISWKKEISIQLKLTNNEMPRTGFNGLKNSYAQRMLLKKRLNDPTDSKSASDIYIIRLSDLDTMVLESLFSYHLTEIADTYVDFDTIPDNVDWYSVLRVEEFLTKLSITPIETLFPNRKRGEETTRINYNTPPWDASRIPTNTSALPTETKLKAFMQNNSQFSQISEEDGRTITLNFREIVNDTLKENIGNVKNEEARLRLGEQLLDQLQELTSAIELPARDLVARRLNLVVNQDSTDFGSRSSVFNQIWHDTLQARFESDVYDKIIRSYNRAHLQDATTSPEAFLIPFAQIYNNRSSLENALVRYKDYLRLLKNEFEYNDFNFYTWLKFPNIKILEHIYKFKFDLFNDDDLKEGFTAKIIKTANEFVVNRDSPIPTLKEFFDRFKEKYCKDNIERETVINNLVKILDDSNRSRTNQYDDQDEYNLLATVFPAQLFIAYKRKTGVVITFTENLIESVEKRIQELASVA